MARHRKARGPVSALSDQDTEEAVAKPDEGNAEYPPDAAPADDHGTAGPRESETWPEGEASAIAEERADAVGDTADDSTTHASEPVDLAGAKPAAVQSSEFRSYIDEVSDKQIQGWILRQAHPSRRCIVT